MKTLREALTDYLEMRRGLGYKLHQEGVQLPKFVSFMERRKADCITTALALEWSQQSKMGRLEPGKRFGRIRVFAKYMKAIDPRTEILPGDFLPPRRRGRPYLYNDEEIRRLLAAAKNRSQAELPRGAYYCLFGLLIATGLRVGEAIRLEVSDVDLTEAILTIRGTKFGKSRLVPLHPTTVRALRNYKRRRDALSASQYSPYFFISRKGTKLFHTCAFGRRA
jgi:integrase/recombinase XerD